MNNSPRKNYSREFKLEAVRMSQQPGVTVAEVARELGLRENDLHTWRQTVKEQGQHAFPGRGRKSQDELSQLKRENARLREENAKLLWGLFHMVGMCGLAASPQMREPEPQPSARGRVMHQQQRFCFRTRTPT